MDITQTGLDDLIERFSRVSAEGRQRAERKALRAVGRLVKAEEILRAPERTEADGSGDALPPGALKADVRARIKMSKGDEPSTVTIGPGRKTSRVAHLVEFGHENRKGKRGTVQTRHGFTPPHPYIRPTAEAVEVSAVTTFMQVAGEELANTFEAK